MVQESKGSEDYDDFLVHIQNYLGKDDIETNKKSKFVDYSFIIGSADIMESVWS